jgi:hypothetical protein
MEVTAKVPAFKCKVCGDKHFRAPRRAQDGAVVADPEGYGFAVSSGKTAADLLYQGKFTQRLK